MKIIKDILAWIIIILLGVVYMFDRAVLIFMPWIEVKSIQDWMPKNTEIEAIQKEFPTLSEESIFTIKYTRKEGIRVMRTSFVRFIIFACVAMCIYVIC